VPELKGRFVCVWNFFIFFVGEYSSVWPEICRVLSKIQSRFLHGILGKKYFGIIFHKFCTNQGYLLPKLVKFRPTNSEILLWIRIALKKFTQVLSYVVFNRIRRNFQKQIRKRRYDEEKPGRFVFGKPILFTLGLGLTTPYSLGIYHTLVTMSTDFWIRIEPQILPTRLVINFLFIIVRAERKVRLCVKLFDFF